MPEFRLSPSDISQIGTTVAEAVSKGSTDPAALKDDGGNDDPAAGLSDDNSYLYSIAALMGENNPSTYKDLPAKMLDMFKRKEEYRAEWEKENPRKKFDWDEDEHSDFTNTVTPNFK